MSIQASVTGRLTADPELKWTGTGKAVANLTIAVNHRKKDQQGNYQDTGTTFLRASLWEYQGEQAAELLRKGQIVTARGRIETRTYTKQDGTEGSSLEMIVDDIGAVVQKYPPKTTPSTDASQQWGGGHVDPWGASPAPAADWGTPDPSRPAF